MSRQFYDNWGAIILSGGNGSRMNGRDKAKLQLSGRSLQDMMVETLERSFEHIALSSGDRLESEEPLPQLLDVRLDGKKIGPVGGILAAIAWAGEKNLDGIITVPVDTPILPDDLFACLVEEGGPAYAQRLDQPHWLHAAWPKQTFSKIENVVTGQKNYSIHGLHKALGSTNVHFDIVCDGVFHNINTEADLREAVTFLSASSANSQD